MTADVEEITKVEDEKSQVSNKHPGYTDFPHFKRVANYLLGSRIGEGSFAKVYAGLHTPTNEKVAIKVINKDQAKQDGYVFKNLHREGKILQMLHHPNILQVYDILETGNNYYLITELCSGGDLIDMIADKGPLKESIVRSYIWQIVNAVAYMHERKIVHRDLKVENLLFDNDGNLKVIDFGLSNSLQPIGNETSSFLNTQCGSPAYAAPELLSKRAYGSKVDVWSIGVITYALLAGKLPFTVEPFHVHRLCKKMLRNEINPMPSNVSHHCRNFIRSLLQPSTLKRPNINEVLRMNWFELYSPELRRYTTPYPFIRNSDHSSRRNLHQLVTHSLSLPVSPNRVSSELDLLVIRKMQANFKYEVANIRYCVQKNRPGPILTTYHLLLNRFRLLQSNSTNSNFPPLGETSKLAKLTGKSLNEKLDSEIQPSKKIDEQFSADVEDTNEDSDEVSTRFFSNNKLKAKIQPVNDTTIYKAPPCNKKIPANKNEQSKAVLLTLETPDTGNATKSIDFRMKQTRKTDGGRLVSINLNRRRNLSGTDKNNSMLEPLKYLSVRSPDKSPTPRSDPTQLPKIILPLNKSKKGEKRKEKSISSRNLNLPSTVSKQRMKNSSEKRKRKTKNFNGDSINELKSNKNRRSSHSLSLSRNGTRKKSFAETISATLSFLKSSGNRSNKRT